MKRREFLSSAIGLTGSLAPILAFGRTAPCPPGVVSVNQGNPVRTACSASTFSEVAEAPQWVNELPVNSGWQPIAGGPDWPGLLPWQRGNRIDDVKATPIDIKGFRAGIQDVIKPWCGGAYNPDRKELLLVANGGGGGYAGNETYTLEFSRDIPGWRRLVDRTPDAYMDVDDNSWSNWSSTTSPGYLTVATHRDGPSGQLGDGRPRAMHTFGQVAYANGRVWNTGQPAATPNLNAQGLFSLDREWVAQQPGDFAPWTLGDIMPFRLHGTAQIVTGSPPGKSFGCCAHDPVTNRLWNYADDTIWAVSTTTGGIEVHDHKFTSQIYSGQTRGGWAVYVPGPDGDITKRVILVGLVRRVGQQILVHDLHSNTFSIAAATPAFQWDEDSYWSNWEAPGVENGGHGMVPGSSSFKSYLKTNNPYLQNEFSYGMGSVYSAADDSVYIGIVPARLGGTKGGQVRVLNPRTMTLTELPNPGMRPIALAGARPGVKRLQWGNLQRFGMVEFGTARVLFHAADSLGPTHAWRIA
jgi:hypothetical protein